MDKNDKPLLANFLRQVSVPFPKVIDRAVVDVYFDALKNNTVADIGNACARLIKNHKGFFPAPSEIQDVINTTWKPSAVPQTDERPLHLTPNEIKWNKMILRLTLKTMEESTRKAPKYVLPADIEAEGRREGFTEGFIEVQMSHYHKALKEMGCDSYGRPINL